MYLPVLIPEDNQAQHCQRERLRAKQRTPSCAGWMQMQADKNNKAVNKGQR